MVLIYEVIFKEPIETHSFLTYFDTITKRNKQYIGLQYREDEFYTRTGMVTFLQFTTCTCQPAQFIQLLHQTLRDLNILEEPFTRYVDLATVDWTIINGK